MSAHIKKKVVETDILSFDYGFCTHIGQRQHNQDEVLVPSAPGTLNGCGKLFAVVDGMGGHSGGGIASRMACDSLNDFDKRNIRRKGKQKPADISRHLVEAVFRIDRTLRLHGIRDSKLENMGTTLSSLIIIDSYSVIAHVGDSRIYRLRKGHLSCLTVDHTFVQDMIFEGEVEPAQARLHPFRHMLTRAVGGGESLELVDARIDRLKPNDSFLLCTDGLYNTIAERDVLDSLVKQAIAANTASELVAKALKNDARDNVTAIVVKITSTGSGYQNQGQ
jgi:protein phosphatase